MPIIPLTLLVREVPISSHRQLCMHHQRYSWDLNMYIWFRIGLLGDKLLGRVSGS